MSRMSQLIVTAVLALFVAKVAFAKEKAKPVKSKASKKLDLQDLEQKYWAPKDTDFNVVQNRTFAKDGKFGVSLMLGPTVNDVYNSGVHYSLVSNYFFSERYGVELSYTSSDLGRSEETTAFLELSGGSTAPDHGRIDNYYSISFNWIPIYAKVSLLGKKIFYFDMAISPGIGMTNYLQMTEDGLENASQSSFAYSLDVTQYFFFTKNVALRLDLKNRWYTEKVVENKSGNFLYEKNSNTTMVLVGGMFYF